jgi:hypothetical protein
MNKKGLLIGGAVALGIALIAGTASAADDALPPVPPTPDPDDHSDPIPPPAPKPKPAPSGQNPPNLSGDPAGYDTNMFPGAQAVRQWFVNMGYSIGNQFLQEPLIENAGVKKFQRNYNKVSAAVAQGKIKGLLGIDRDFPMGTVDVDGTAGKNTLNALSIAFRMSDAMQKAWVNLVKAA